MTEVLPKPESAIPEEPDRDVGEVLNAVISRIPEEHLAMSDRISDLTNSLSLRELRTLKGVELVDRYLAFLSNCTVDTIDVYRVHLLQFFEVVGTDDVAKVDGEVVADYVFFIQQERYAKDTIKLKLGRVMAFLKFCEDLKLLNFPLTLISHLIKAPRVHAKILTVKDIFDSSDIEKLRVYFNNQLAASGDKQSSKKRIQHWRDMLVFSIGLNTGVRVSEIANIKIGDLFDYDGKWFIKILGKGSKTFEVPLSDRDLNQVIKPYLIMTGRSMKDMKSFLLLGARSNGESPMNRTAIFKIIKKVCLAADIRKSLSPHSLRHTYATNLALKGADIHTIKEALHHESISTSERYIHMAEHLKDKIRQYSLDGFSL